MMGLRIQRHFDTNRLVVEFNSPLSGRWLPLLNEHGQIVDLSLELRLSGELGRAGAISDRLRLADQIFSEWDQ